MNAAAIMCKFMSDEFGRYTAVIADQQFLRDDPPPKVYGRHLAGKKNSDVRVIDCANKENKFEVFPATLTQIFPNTEVLMLQNSGLTQLSPESFKFTPLVKIMMFANDNFTIEAGVFRGSVSLEVLKFEEIDFSHTEPDVFNGADDLKILSMKKCKFNESNLSFLEPISSLSELYITQSSLLHPPLKATQNMPLLKILDLSGNKLTYLHNDLVENKHFLDLLDLSENEINEIQRTLLEIWPNNAALNLDGNNCIKQNFGHMGTSELPLFDVVVHFMQCFHQSEDEENKTSESDEEEVISKSQETTIIAKKGSVSDEKSGGSVSDEIISDEKDEISKEFEGVKVDVTNAPSKEEVVFEGTDSPFEFAKKTEQSGSSSEETESESGSDEVETTEATTTTTTVETTTEEAKTKKKKKKKKKNGETTDMPATIESLTTQEFYSIADVPEEPEFIVEAENKTSEEAAVVIEEKATEMIVTEEAVVTEGNATEATVTEEKIIDDEKSTTEEMAKGETVTPSYLHPYEQASCRFFIDADRGYNCVLENVTADLKRINVDHFGTHDNRNVTGLFLRDSTLIKIPHIFFTNFENLLHLSIEETNIKQLDDDTLKEGCGNLETLILKRNKIRVVESESLKTCIALKLLDISDNPIERIEGGIFESNPHLNIKMGSLQITAAHANN